MNIIGTILVLIGVVFLLLFAVGGGVLFYIPIPFFTMISGIMAFSLIIVGLIIG